MFVYNREDIRKIDKNAINQGFSMYSLMENAGKGLFQKVKSVFTKNDRILIIADSGNNDVDGVVRARYLNQNGYKVSLTFPLGLTKTDVAKEQLNYYEKQGFSIEKWRRENKYDVLIDAILGIGTKLPLQLNLEELIVWCNHASSLKIAIDIPTGITVDHGEFEFAFHADYTFCLHGIKPSAFLLPSHQYYGVVDSVDIGLLHTSQIRVLQKD